MNFLKNDPALKDRRRGLRRSQTDAERLFWAKVRNRQFFGLKFFRQYSYGPYILDFFCPEKNLAVELDGGQHNLPHGRVSDGIRTQYLNDHGIEVVRFWNNEVLSNPDGVLASLVSSMLSRKS